MRARTPLLTTLALVLGLSGCSGGDPGSESGANSSAAPGASATAATPTEPAPPPGPAARLGLETGWGPSTEQLDAAARRAKRMSLPDLAGQVIVASYPGQVAPLGLVRRLHLGGVIAFSDNVASTAQVRRVNRTLRRQVRRPLLISVDQEGGQVERVRADNTRFPAFMSAGAADDSALTTEAYAGSGAELAGLGFNVDFAPVADVTTPRDPTIGARAAGDDPRLVADQVIAAAEGYLDAGVVPVLKHFPGHGSVPADSHRTLPVQTRTLAQLRKRDLVPFAAAVDAGLPAIMVGHLDVRALAPRRPATLSGRVVTGLLREDLGFAGLVVTDALEMAAVAARFDSRRSAPLALAAGVDVVLMPPDPAAARAGIIAAVRSGRLPRRRVEQAAARMLGLLAHQRTLADAATPAGPGAARPLAARLSRAALTSVAGPCTGRLVDAAVTPIGDAAAVATFAAAARAAGIDVLLPRAAPTRLTVPAARPVRPAAPQRPAKPNRRERREYRAALAAYRDALASYQRRLPAWRRAESRRRAELGAWQAAENARLATGTSIAFAGPGSAGYDAAVLVATDSPYVLGRSSAPTRLATFGSTPAAMSALVQVLLGREEAPGRLPVRVPGVRVGCTR